MRKEFECRTIFVVCLFSIILLLGAQNSFGAESSQNCLAYDVPSNVELSKISYFLASYKGTPRLHMEVELKNTSQDMNRYRVHIYLPDGVAGGGLYPRKEKGIPPGETHSRTFPMYYDELPSSFEISVQELKE